MNHTQCTLLLTATTPISHHDPDANNGDSNTLTFYRRKMLLPGVEHTVSSDEAQAIADTFRVPDEIAPALIGLTAGQLVAIATARAFIAIHGGHDGDGLFAGMERYRYLETRLRDAGTRTSNLRTLWDALTRDLQVSVQFSKHDEDLLRLWSLPASVQRAACSASAREYRSIVTIAREWHKSRSSDGGLFSGVAVDLLPEDSGPIPVEIPAVSSNSARHQAVREPAMRILLGAVGISPATLPGGGDLPLSVESLLYNGGNIKAGAKQAGNAFVAAATVRATYPSLDLLGGVCDSFDLGPSRLGVSAHVVCRECAAALQGTPLEGQPLPSVFDLIDEQTATRQEGRTGEGQMIYKFETLAPGTQVLIRCTLEPFTPELTAGALASALDAFVRTGCRFGGQYARGMGWMDAEMIEPLPDHTGLADAYMAYLADNRERLRDGLTSGSLGMASPILS